MQASAIELITMASAPLKRPATTMSFTAADMTDFFSEHAAWKRAKAMSAESISSENSSVPNGQREDELDDEGLDDAVMDALEDGTGAAGNGFIAEAADPAPVAVGTDVAAAVPAAAPAPPAVETDVAAAVPAAAPAPVAVGTDVAAGAVATGTVPAAAPAPAAVGTDVAARAVATSTVPAAAAAPVADGTDVVAGAVATHTVPTAVLASPAFGTGVSAFEPSSCLSQLVTAVATGNTMSFFQSEFGLDSASDVSDMSRMLGELAARVAKQQPAPSPETPRSEASEEPPSNLTWHQAKAHDALTKALGENKIATGSSLGNKFRAFLAKDEAS